MAKREVQLILRLKDLATKGFTSFGTTAKKVAGIAGAAFVAIGIKATKMAVDFESQMTRVSTLVDTNVVDMKKLSSGVLDLFKSLPVKSMADLSDGLFDIISAGVPASESLNVLGTVARTAVGGFTDVKTVAKGVTAALNAFSSEGLTATEVTDAFFVANKRGATTIGELSDGIGKSASLANSLGVSFDDLLANATALTLGGLKTSEAFTSLTATFANILTPSQELLRRMPDLASEFNAASLKAKGLTQFMVDLAEKTEGDNEATKLLFGSVEALKGVLSLTAGEGSTVASVTEDMANKAGEGAEAFKKANESTEAMYLTAKNRLSVVLVDLGARVLPFVTKALRGYSVLFDELDGTSRARELDRLTRSVNQLSTAVDPGTSIRLALLSKRLRDLAGGPDKAAFAGPSALAQQLDTFRSVLIGLQKEADSLGRDQLLALRNGLLFAAQSGQLTTKQMVDLGASLNIIFKRLSPSGGQIIAPIANAVPDSVATLKARLVELNNEIGVRAVQVQRQLTRTQAKELLARDTALADSMRGQAKTVEEGNARLAELDRTLSERQRIANEARQKSAKETAERLTKLNDEIALKTVQAEQQITEQQAKEYIQRQQDLGGFTQTQVGTISGAYAELDRLNTILAAGLSRDLIPRIKESGTALRTVSRDTVETAEAMQVLALKSRLTIDVVRQLTADGFSYDAAAKQWVRTTKDGSQKVDELSRSLEQGARSAIDTAGALGLVGRAAQGTLNTIVNLGASIAAVFSGGFSAQGVIGIISGVGSLVKGIFGGKSPAQKAAEAVLKQNTNVLRDNSLRLGDLVRLSTPGAQLAGVQEVLSRFLIQFSGKPDTATSKESTRTALAGLLASKGVGLGDLDRLAQDLGLTIKDSKGNFILGGLRQLLSVLGSIEPTQFANTFAGQREALGREATLFDLSPAEQAKRLAALAGGPLGSGAIGSRLFGINFGTAEGREAGLQAIRQLFLDLPTLSARDLGGLSGSDFLRVLEDLKGFLQDATDAPLATLGDPLPVVAVAPPATMPSLGEVVVGGLSSIDIMHESLGALQTMSGSLGRIESLLSSRLPQPGTGALSGRQVTVTIGSVNLGGGLGGFSREDLAREISMALAREVFLADQAVGRARVRVQ